MSDPMTHIVVAGGAEVSRENVEDLLKDWLLIDTKEEKEFRIFLPADVDYIGDAVVHTATFLNDLSEGYTAVRGASSAQQVGNSLKVKQLARGAEDVIKVEGDGIMATYLVGILKHAKAEGNDAYLFLAWGDGDEAPDDVTQDLLELAADADIPVKDLTAGLDDLSFDEEEPESAEDVEEEEEVTEQTVHARLGRIKDKVAKVSEKIDKELKETERELEDEAQADMPGQIEGQPAIPDLITVLAFVAQKLDFEDRANAAVQMQAHFNRPLTLAVRHHLAKLQAESGPTVKASVTMPETPAKAAETVQEPLPEAEEEKPRARRGKARDTAEDLVKVYVNETNKTLRLVPGRGRPKKGEEPQEMLRTEYQELIDSGEYTPF